jgi:protein SCO1
MTPRRIAQIAAGSLAGLALALVLVLSLQGRTAQSGAGSGAEFLLPAPVPAADFALVAHTGDTVRLAELGRDQALALFFGYTHCPDVCPLTMATLGRAIAALGPDAARVQGILITVDPARDSVAQLASWVARFPSGILGLTGDEETLRAAAKAYMQYAERRPEPPAHDHDEPAETRPGVYLVDHTTRVLVVRDGRILMTFTPDASAADMTRGLALVLER